MDACNPYPALQRFVATGGAIDIGRIDVLESVAFASDPNTLWVALSGRPGEQLGELMQRLDATLAYCLANDVRVDEVELPREAMSASVAC